MSGSDINLVMLTGRLGADPEGRALPSGEPVCNFRIAVGQSWKDKSSGEAKEKVEWVGMVAFGNLATICTDHLRKGSQIAVTGSIRTRKWQDKSGNDRYTTEVVADRLRMMGSKPADAGAPAPAQQAQQPKPAPAPAQTASPYGHFDDDSIPF